jgi:hypothetical protein
MVALFSFLKDMTGTLAPFSFLVIKIFLSNMLFRSVEKKQFCSL